MTGPVNGELSPWDNVLQWCSTRNSTGTPAVPVVRSDLPDYVRTYMRMFADIQRYAGKYKEIEDSAALQNDLIGLMEWSERWLIISN